MTFQEKKNIVAIISTLLISFGYYWIVFHHYYEPGMDQTELFVFWAKVILILIPVSIVAKILVHILFGIFYKVTTQEDPTFFEDERDKMIELKSTRISHYVFVFGFLLAMVVLLLGYPPVSMFIVLTVAGLVSEVAGNLSQLYFYRRGF